MQYLRFLHSCLTLLPHTAEAGTHSHQLICALVNLHYLRLSIERFSRIPPLARSTIGNPRMILIRFKEPSEEFRVKSEKWMKPKPDILIKTECNDLEYEEEKKLYKYFIKKIFQSAHFRWVGRVRGNKAIFYFGLNDQEIAH